MNTAQDLYAFDLGDKKLNRRAARIVQAGLNHPGASIPEAAGSRAATDGTYRFYSNPNVLPDKLDDAHRRYTLGLLAETQGPVLLVQDTTPADFTSPGRLRRLGQLAHAQHCGFFIHSCLALSADGLPLGLLTQHVWERSPTQRGKRKHRRHKATQDKESQRWIATEQASLAALPPERTVVTVADRECDFYDYFALPRRAGQHVLIRAKLRRRIAASKELLGVAVRNGPVRGTLCVQVPRKDGQPGRKAILTVRYGTYAILPPSTHPRRKQLTPLPLQAVYLEELDPPPGVKKPLRWLLLTSLPLTSWAEVEQVVRWYTYRWRIERYHFVLKSGCKLEELQLETSERLRRALSISVLVAARLLHLTYRARQEPEASCVPTLSAEEWEVLWCHFQVGQPLPEQPPSLALVIFWIARLGGFLARKGDGAPGVKVVWRGMRKLQAMVLGYRLAKARVQNAPPPPYHAQPSTEQKF